MRAYAGLVAAIVLTATSCELEQSFECIRPGTDHCPCVELQCDMGLSCVNGTCFDLSVFWTTRPSAAGNGAASAGSEAVVMSVMTGMPNVSSAGVGGAGAAAGSSAAGSSSAAAGSSAAASAAAIGAAGTGAAAIGAAGGGA